MKPYTLRNTDIHTGNLILVNPKYQYQEPGKKQMVTVTEQASHVQMDRQAAILLSELMQKIHGWSKIVPVSGWRSLQEQQGIWNDTLAESGTEFTKKFVAVPGHSEHQTGLAIDLGLKKDTIDFICPEFPYSGICQVFRRNAPSYGFVERYPSGKETITGIGHEPWHFRYVGVPHSFIMEENDLTLEEYIDFIRDYPYQSRPYHYQNNRLNVTVSYLKAAQDGSIPTALDTNLPYSISGNNIDGFIITEWRGTNG